MAFYTIDFTVTAEGVTPSTPQAAGYTGDHKAAVVRFRVPFEGCRYRLEIVDGCGGYDTTALLDADAGVVSYEIPSAWTAAGVATLRLVAVEQDGDDTEIVRFHAAPAYVRFEDREDGEPLGETVRPAWQEALDEAQFLLKTVEQKLEAGELNGKDGEKGDKGDKGADGYTPQKGVDYYTDSEKEELVAELGARDVDQALDADSKKAIANCVVYTLADNLSIDLSVTRSDLYGHIAERIAELENNQGTINSDLFVKIGAVESELRSGISENAESLDVLEEAIGDVDTALDGILAIQESLIGGEAE